MANKEVDKRPSSEARDFELVEEGSEEVMRINAVKWPYSPSIEDNAAVMGFAIEKLLVAPHASRIIFKQRRNYSYDYKQTQMLVEIALLYDHLVRQKKVFGPSALGGLDPRFLQLRASAINYIIFNLLKSDPIGAYVELKRLIREEKILLKGDVDARTSESRQVYLNTLLYIYTLLGKTRLIENVKDELDGYSIGDRGLYKEIFRPVITPDFMYTRLMAEPPLDGEQIDFYSVNNVDVTVYKIPGDIKTLYHVNPPEFKLTEDEYALLDLAKTVLAEHKPREEEFLDPTKMRRTFFNIGRDLISELAETKRIILPYSKIQELAEILVRYTVGFGLIEILLQDPKIQDITINGPVGENPIFVMHQDYDECITNVVPSHEDADSWASKFRLISGRPLDEANPVLDTELSIPGARARVAVMTNPLSPTGLAYALRRHRDMPWTLPLFIQNKMINPLGAGLISFLVDGARTMLIAGTRSSGKTSVLGSVLIEIMRRYRIITIEDTLELSVKAMRDMGYNIQQMKVRAALMTGGAEVAADEGIRTSLRLGDSSLIVGEVRSSIRGTEDVVIVRDGFMQRIQIKDLEGKDLSNIYVPTLGFDLKVKLSKLCGFVKHPKRKKLLRIKTKTGREVVVTPDHSLFAPTQNFEIAPKECKDLKKGDQIVIPSFMPCGFNDIQSINVFEYLPEFRVQNFEVPVRNAIKTLGWKKATEICKIDTGDVYNYFRTNQKTNIPFSSFSELTKLASVDYGLDSLLVKKGTSLPIPALIPVNEDFCRFLGYYVSEGYYALKEKEGGKVVITNSNLKIIEDLHNISLNLFKLLISSRKVVSLGSSIQHSLHCLPLAKLISKLGCGRTCEEKRVPPILFGLSKHKIASFLRGLYSGDGSFTSSKVSGNSVRYSSASKGLVEDVSYLLLNFGIVSTIREREPSGIGKLKQWILEFKDRKMVETFFNEIGFVRTVPKMMIRKWAHTTSNYVKFDKKILREHLKKYPRKYRHLFRFLRCSKNYLNRVVLDPQCEVSKKLKDFALGQFYLDEVKEIVEINLEDGEHVYDLSVEPCQNFIGGFGGVLLHNTEAKALYEAMRVGALANVVAGTIHGADPYGVYDRVVNDLGVPKTSFKATDVIIVANPIKSPDGLHKWKRITQITEVRKHWVDDPIREKGFVDLMKYNPEKDTLEPTPELINGESETLKAVAGNVREWAGNWDAIWENVLLRAKLKETLVNYSKNLNRKDILEAPFVVQSNDMFHRIADDVRTEVGSLDPKLIYDKWEEWLKNEVKKKIL